MGRGPEQQITSPMRRHLRWFQTHNVHNYLDWCSQHDFEPSYDKSMQQMQREKEAYEKVFEQVEKQGRIEKNPQKFLKQAIRGRLDPEVIARPIWQHIAKSLNECNDKPEYRESLEKFLVPLSKRTKFVFEQTEFSDGPKFYIDALIKIHDRKGLWLNPPAQWKPKTHNRERQFSELIRHFFAKYDVPRFMDSVWFRRDAGSHKYRDAFIHIGRGHNLRTAKLPLKLTKKMAHLVLHAPDNMTMEHALKWAQIQSLGGDDRLSDALLGSRWSRDFERDNFWQSVVRFFINNPMLDTRYVGPIVDFIYAHKFDEVEALDEDRRVITIPPPQPGFSLRNRNVAALIGQVDLWHGRLAKRKASRFAEFKPSGIHEFRLALGKKNARLWTIQELLSTEDLFQEGEAQGHCVASYAWACQKGMCSIWSLSLQADGQKRRVQTIEVSKTKMIVQCRGRFNALPTLAEFKIVEDWANAADLTISEYVRRSVTE